MATRTDRVSVRLGVDELSMLHQLATAMGVSTSDALRASIRETFTRHRPAPKGRGGAKKAARRAATATRRR